MGSGGINPRFTTSDIDVAGGCDSVGTATHLNSVGNHIVARDIDITANDRGGAFACELGGMCQHNRIGSGGGVAHANGGGSIAKNQLRRTQKVQFSLIQLELAA